MDIDLLRTFLEVHRTRHFGRAADNLYLSQSAISARIRHLEDQVGTPLFTRDRNDIRLTAVGKRLLPHAESIVTAWHRARQEVTLGTDMGQSLSVGGTPSMWDILMQDWLQQIYQKMPDLALTADVAGPNELLRSLLDGTIDLALTFESPQVVRLNVVELKSIPLVMVSSQRGIGAAKALAKDYLLVDWGTSFLTTHAKNFKDCPSPRLRVGLGRIAYDFLLHQGGSAYLAQPMVQKDLDNQRLFPVEDAPIIKRPAFAVYPERPDNSDAIECALALLS